MLPSVAFMTVANCLLLLTSSALADATGRGLGIRSQSSKDLLTTKNLVYESSGDGPLKSGISQTHNLTLVIMAETSFQLNLADKTASGSSPSVQTISSIVEGNGPFVVAIDVSNTGSNSGIGYSGMLAVLLLDNRVISYTGDTNWLATSEHPSSDAWFTDATYIPNSPAVWQSTRDATCSSAAVTEHWAAQRKVFLDLTGVIPQPTWIPSCSNTGTVKAPIHNYFRLIVSGKGTMQGFADQRQPSEQRKFYGKLVGGDYNEDPDVLVSDSDRYDEVFFNGSMTGSSHNITVIMAVDNIFHINIAGHIIRGPFDSPQVNTHAWSKINVLTRTVYGDGPFHIAVDAADFG
eukprot:jgi/Hompol1/2764/HPOL_003026-RA